MTDESRTFCCTNKHYKTRFRKWGYCHEANGIFLSRNCFNSAYMFHIFQSRERSAIKKVLAFVVAFLMAIPALATDYYLENLNTTDTYIRSSAPNNSFDGADLITGGWGDMYISMVKFDISSLPAVSSADKVSVWFYNRSSGGAATPTQVQMGLLATNFGSSTTWNNAALSWYTSTIRNVDVSNYGYWTEFDITDYYNYWKNNVFPNYGFALVPVNMNNNFNFFPSSSVATAWGQKPVLRITSQESSQFLSFPLSVNLYPQGPYTPGKINTVLDHYMANAYESPKNTPNSAGLGTILSFTGELFQTNYLYPIASLACYPKAGGASWSPFLSTLYKGTSDNTGNCLTNVALNYEGHPGYDYVATVGTPVYAAAEGIVVSANGGCVPKGIAEGCSAWGAVGIDHGNGYITQYLHLSNISVVPGQHVFGDYRTQIGSSGNKSPKGQLGEHLHFEVLRLRNGASNDFQPANYATVDPYGFDASKGYADYITTFNNNRPNVCLWKTGCKFQ